MNVVCPRVVLGVGLLTFFLVGSVNQVYRRDMRLAANAWNEGSRSQFEELMGYHSGRIDRLRSDGFLLSYLRSRYHELDQVEVLEGLPNSVAVSTLDYHEEQLAIAYIDGEISLFNLSSYEPRQLIETQLLGDVVKFSPNGHLLAAIGKELPLSIVNRSDLKAAKKVELPNKSFAHDIAFIDDHRLACLSDSIVQLYSIPALEPLGQSTDMGSDDLYRAHLTVSPNRKLLAAALDEAATIFEVDGEQLKATAFGIERKEWINVLRFLSDTTLLVGGEDGLELLFIGDDFNSTPLQTLDVRATCATSMGGVIAVGTSDFKVWAFDSQLNEIGRLLQKDFCECCCTDARCKTTICGRAR